MSAANLLRWVEAGKARANPCWFLGKLGKLGHLGNLGKLGKLGNLGAPWPNGMDILAKSLAAPHIPGTSPAWCWTVCPAKWKPHVACAAMSAAIWQRLVATSTSTCSVSVLLCSSCHSLQRQHIYIYICSMFSLLSVLIHYYVTYMHAYLPRPRSPHVWRLHRMPSSKPPGVLVEGQQPGARVPTLQPDIYRSVQMAMTCKFFGVPPKRSHPQFSTAGPDRVVSRAFIDS